VSGRRTTTAYDLMGFRLVAAARNATYTQENIGRAFEATAIWPLNRRRVLVSRARPSLLRLDLSLSTLHPGRLPASKGSGGGCGS